MTNYTYEQRKMIADYLEQLKDESGLYMDWHDDGERKVIDATIEAVPVEDIDKLIKELKTATFGDIKNQVGTKFNVEGEKYAIGFDKEYQCYQLINLKTFSINDLNLIEDAELVEVINETETD